MKIIIDTKWALNKSISKEHRGIHDYEKTMSFEKELNEHDIKAICKSLHEDPKCPGWTSVTGRRLNTGIDNLYIYKFYTCYDSSD